MTQVLIDTDGDGVADQREVYAGGRRTRVEADTNGDGRPDVLQLLTGDAVTRQDEDVDFDGRVDRRFEAGKPVVLSSQSALPGERFGKLDCGRFDRFWSKR